MGDISQHFSRSEFACHCDANNGKGCGFDAVDIELLDILEKVREKFEKPVHLNCACRCLEKNRSIGSKDTSQHVKGKAADIRIDGIAPEEIVFWLDNDILKGRGGLGIYDTFSHIDDRKDKARWDKRT